MYNPRTLPLQAGTKLGPYEIVSLVGAGGMGEVYKARDARLGRDVAIKILPAAITNEGERLKRFEQEARSVAALNHPNILTIYEINTHAGSPYLVSELLEGGTLQSRLREGALPLRKALEIAVHAAHGVAAAHEKNIVHRDLKPANILLTADGRVKILDFGLAKLTQPDVPVGSQTQTNADATMTQMLATPPSNAGPVTEEGVVLGTMGYMSPEQVRGKPADGRSDIFALGTILYEMLSGHRAFQRDSSADTMAAILKEDPPELSGEGKPIPPAVDRVVRHALEKNPAERFQSARDFAFDLESLSGVSSSSSATASAAAAQARAQAEIQAREQAAANSMGKKLGAVIAAVALASVVGATTWLIARQSIHATPPKFTRLTFKRGYIVSALFMPAAQSVLYSASWDGAPIELYEQRLGSPEARSVGLPSQTQILSISSTGELAVLISQRVAGPFQYVGTLAEVGSSGSAPREIAEGISAADWSSDGKQLAIVRYSPASEVLEYPIGKVVYKTNGWVGDPRISPDGQHIAFVDHEDASDDGGSIAIVDLAGNKKLLTSRYSSARGLAWHDDEIYFTATATGSARALFAVSLAGSQRAVAASPGSMNLNDVAKDGRVLFNQSDERIEMAVVGTHDNAPPRAMGWLDWALASDITPDGKMIVFGESGEGAGANYGVYIRKTDGSPAVRLGDGGSGAISPDGKWVATPDAAGTANSVSILPVGAGEPRHLTDAAMTGLNVNWTVDSKSVLYVHLEQDGQRRVYRESIDGTDRKPVTPAGESFAPARGAVSPDGKFLIARRLSDHAEVLIALDGSGAIQVVPGIDATEVARHWSSDGKSIYIQNRGNLQTGSQVIKFDVATGKREAIKTILPADLAGYAGNDGQLVSADGSTIVFSYTRILSTLYTLEQPK
jgi:eukaryotic-like serine/threonine-protein kinase